MGVLNWINLDSQCGSAIHKLDEPLGSSLKEIFLVGRNGHEDHIRLCV